METATIIKSKFKVGDTVLISPDITQEKEWVKGVVIDVEDNSFVGYVITAETEDKVIFLKKKIYLEKPNVLCMQSLLI